MDGPAQRRAQLLQRLLRPQRQQRLRHPAIGQRVQQPCQGLGRRGQWRIAVLQCRAPQLYISLVLLVMLTLTNLVSVKSFGEFEFWFASIKVAAIVVFLFVAGVYVLGLTPASQGMHFGNLTGNGGFMPNGIVPVLTGAVAATGFYFGAEIVTIAAAETAEPQKAVAKATSSVITRVLVFYVGSIFLVACLVPWNAVGIATPYVSALNTMGVPAAAQIMNAIVLTAVLSALNSGLYASSRMLFALTRRGDAPQALAKVSRNGVPTRAILVATVFGYGAVVKIGRAHV